MVKISNTDLSKITVSFSYNPDLVQKVKSIKGYKYHPEGKYWSFPNTNGTLEKILKVFEGEKIHIDPALQANLSTSVIARSETTNQYQGTVPDLGTKQGEVVESGLSLSPVHNFEDLIRELISRKYSYKTVKGYTYFNKDFLNFTGKQPADINESDIKNYLFYLAEEKKAATSTLNQAINALKFYYGTMLKRKFVYEVKNKNCLLS